MIKQLNLIYLLAISISLFTGCKKNKPVTLTIMGETTVSDITATTAVLTGNVLEIGENMEVYGYVWGETEEPVISSNLKSEHTDTKTGSFVDELTNLKPETKYYVRAYAKDAGDVVYKDAVSFTTLQDYQSINILTDDISNISYTTASCGGNVLNEGESPVIVRGICWSTSEYPTTEDFKTEEGSGIGAYTSSMSGLNDNTSYYVRAYATNNEGTVYGEQKSFTTVKLPEIGDFYEGGVIFYLDETGIHGLVCAVSNQDTGPGARWGCGTEGISGADGTAIGTGSQNTEDIEAGCSMEGTAADLCANLDLNGYTDWFLPSKDELKEMHTVRETINTTASANGGDNFTPGSYWSSSEFDDTNAWLQDFSQDTPMIYDPKLNNYYIRAVRAF